jgi:ribosomal protein S18 acetylase RimI-like enzyme
MCAKEIIIRDMELNQVPEVARVHANAFPGYMNTQLGQIYLQAFFRWFCLSNNSIALCAYEGDRMVGYAIGAPQGYSSQLTRSLFLTAFLNLLIRPWLLFRRQVRRAIFARLRILTGNISTSAGPVLTPPVYSFVGLGVLTNMRGKKVGWSLMQAFESLAFNSGAQSILLTVYRDNNARKLYERNGWFVHDGSPDSPTVVYYKQNLITI